MEKINKEACLVLISYLNIGLSKFIYFSTA